MRNGMSWIKVISFNVLITLSLIGLVMLMPPFVYTAYKLVVNRDVQDTRDNRAELALYDSYAWARKHFEEFNNLPSTYYDFITWRRDDYFGETINISNGVRHTVSLNPISPNNGEYWFFGGSTTWGTGVTDAYTYPSMFAETTDNQVKNFGETGYIARQSLAFLSNQLISNSLVDLSNLHVVFYDGVNDVVNRCRREIIGLGTARENQIQTLLSSDSFSNPKYSFQRTFSQLTNFLVAVSNRLTSGTGDLEIANRQYNCSTDINRATEVAQTLVNTWKAASDIVESRGGKFTAILQPVAFYGRASTDYLNLSSANSLALARQYEAVYPLIIEIAKKNDIRFADLTNIYDGCEVCYIDFGHVGPQAHQILINSLVAVLDE